MPNLHLEKQIEQALAKAEKAMVTANAVRTDQEKHEAVCAQRYEGINQRLDQLPEIARAIGGLKGKINMAIGGIGAISVLSLILGIFYTVSKMVG